jgi:hypothetical protein
MKFKKTFLFMFIFLFIFTNVYAADYYKLDSEGNVVQYDEEGNRINDDKPIEHLDKIKPVLDYLKNTQDETIVKVSENILEIEGLEQEIEIPLDIPVGIRSTPNGLELFREGDTLRASEEIEFDLTKSEIKILNHQNINIGGTFYSLFDGRLILSNKGVSLKGKFYSLSDEHIKYNWDKDEILKLSQIIQKKEIIYKKEKDRSFTLEIPGDMDSIEIAGKVFKNFKDAKFKVDKDGNLVYASFEVGVSQETYELEYKGKNYVLQSQGRFKVIFNPLEGIIETNGDVKIKIDDYSVSAGKKTIIKLDEEGSPSLISSESGTFYLDEEDPSVITQLSVEKGVLKVVFNKEDFVTQMTDIGNNPQGEGIIFVNKNSEEEREVYLGGKINGFIENIEYSVMSNSALTVYNNLDKFFDVIEGNVRITNEVYELNIRGGEAFLKKINHNPGVLHQSFSFKHRDENGNEITGYLDSDKSKYHYNGFEINLNRIGFTRELGMDFMQATDEERTKFSLESKIDELKTELESLRGHSKTSKEIELMQHEMQLKILKGESHDIDADIKSVRDLIKSLPSGSELRAPGESFLGD